MEEKLWEWNLIKFIIRIMQIEENSIVFPYIYIFLNLYYINIYIFYEFNFLVLLYRTIISRDNYYSTMTKWWYNSDETKKFYEHSV